MMSDIDMPLTALRIQLASAVNIICQVVAPAGRQSRKITHITEVLGFDANKGEYLLQDIFVRQYHGFDEQGRDHQRHRSVGDPAAVPAAAARARSRPARLASTRRPRTRRPASTSYG